jgi:protein-arginine deiminase
MAIRSKQKWFQRLATVATGAALTACGTTPSGGPSGALPADAAGADSKVSNAPVVDLVVDANRDGVADPKNADDQKYGAVFDDLHGASFLANVDDDDGDKVRDGDDEVVNGDDDALDLARIVLSPWPGAPDGAVGKLTLDAVAADNVRIFQKMPDGSWAKLMGEFGPCVSDAGDDCTVLKEAGIDAATLRTGAEFGIEGRRFRSSESEVEWSGMATVKLLVTVAGKPVEGALQPDGTDTVKLRVAPWVLHGNTSPFDLVRSSNVAPEFVSDLKKAVPAAGLTYMTYLNSKWSDQWTQDFYQTAWTAMPAPGGKMQWMRIANARPWGRNKTKTNPSKNLPYTWLTDNYLAKDQGIIAIYKPENEWGGSSYDSHGNHDLLPPYENGTAKYPLGQIVHGSGILDETHEFYGAQKVQGPVLEVLTDWLLVGHVDEVLSYVPAKTARGWKLLIGSNALAKQMFEKASKDGHGAVKFWTGLTNYTAAGKAKNAEVTIDETLADQDLMKWSQQAGANVDIVHDQVVKAVGLTEDEIIPIPFLTEDLGAEQGKPENKIAWQPGTVNSLVMNDHIAMPNPFGPMIDGVDLFAKDLQDRLGTAVNALGKDGLGLKVHLIDDWAGYHINEGEVHCGSNPEGPPPTNKMWWEVGR